MRKPNNIDSLILGFQEYREPAKRLAAAAGLPYKEIDIHRFPDGESRVRLPAQLPERVIICRSLNDPNHKLVELSLIAATARELGVSELVLVAPYLCYMRQDKAFCAGEAVSQTVIGRLLAQWFDGVITVDPHLHRVHNFHYAVPARTGTALTAARPIADFLVDHCSGALLVGPDEESEQWVTAVARIKKLDYVIGKKQRLDDSTVKITLPESACTGRELVLLDDIASTGHTLESTARALALYKPASISTVVTHALFVGDAITRLQQAGIRHIWSTDSIPHATNAIRLDKLIADEL